VSFGGDIVIHALLQHRFSTARGAQSPLILTAATRQFSSFVVLGACRRPPKRTST
jgi:hypothetical protein